MRKKYSLANVRQRKSDAVVVKVVPPEGGREGGREGEHEITCETFLKKVHNLPITENVI